MTAIKLVRFEMRRKKVAYSWEMSQKQTVGHHLPCLLLHLSTTPRLLLSRFFDAWRYYPWVYRVGLEIKYFNIHKLTLLSYVLALWILIEYPWVQCIPDLTPSIWIP